jgi:hypothetical protein
MQLQQSGNHGQRESSSMMHGPGCRRAADAATAALAADLEA